MYPRIKELRIQNNLIEKDIANILGISEKEYLEYETGKKVIPVSLAIKLAKQYNTSIDYIVGDTDQIEPYR